MTQPVNEDREVYDCDAALRTIAKMRKPVLSEVIELVPLAQLAALGHTASEHVSGKADITSMHVSLATDVCGQRYGDAWYDGEVKVASDMVTLTLGRRCQDPASSKITDRHALSLIGALPEEWPTLRSTLLAMIGAADRLLDLLAVVYPTPAPEPVVSSPTPPAPPSAPAQRGLSGRGRRAKERAS